MEQNDTSAPIFAPLPLGAADDLIALQSLDYRICIPVPPWSTARDFHATNRIDAWGPAIPRDIHEGADWITWRDDVSPRAAEFHMIPSAEPTDGFRRQYDVRIEPFDEARFQAPNTAREVQRHIVVSEPDRQCWIESYDSPFGVPKTYLQAVCVLRIGADMVSLCHAETFQTFNAADPSQWPVSLKEMEQRAQRLARMTAVSLTTSSS